MGPHTAGAVLLAGLRAIPESLTTQLFDSHAPFLSSIMFAQLLKNTESCKRLAREVIVPSQSEEDDEQTNLLQVLIGNLIIAQREQGHCANNAQANPMMDALAVEWTRVMVAYLTVLSIWCWESPRTVKDFLSEGAHLQVVRSLCLDRMLFLSLRVLTCRFVLTAHPTHQPSDRCGHYRARALRHATWHSLRIQ